MAEGTELKGYGESLNQGLTKLVKKKNFFLRPKNLAGYTENSLRFFENIAIFTTSKQTQNYNQYYEKTHTHLPLSHSHCDPAKRRLRRGC